MLAGDDFRTVTDMLAAIRDVRSREEMIQIMLQRLAEVLGSDCTAYNDISPTAAATSYINPVELDVDRINRALENFGHEHPIMRDYLATRKAGTRRFSDFVSQRQLHDLGLYSELFGPLNIEFQIALVLPGRPGVVRGLAFNRNQSDFTDRDRAILDVLQPHITGALESLQLAQRMRAKLTRGYDMIESLPEGVVLLRDAGRIEFCNRQARSLLRKYFPDAMREPHALPEEVTRWIRRRLSPGADMSGQSAALVKELGEGQRLKVRMICSSDGSRMLVLSDTATVHTAQPLESLGLSPRQAEVLLHLTNGCTNHEIARRLQISPHTARRHVEAIFRILKVNTRTEACRMAVELQG